MTATKPPRWIRWLTLTLLAPSLLALMSGCSTVVATPAGAPVDSDAAQAAWARVLSRFVNDQGEVDFAALAADRSDLDQVVRHIAETPLRVLEPGPARLAYEINAYNALAMFNVVQSGIPASHTGLRKLRFFVLRQFDVGGTPMSLRTFENDVIRPDARALNDPRVHFALNCMALSCPSLPRTPFTADGLDAELARETRAFFARPRNFRVDEASTTVWLSELLDFYEDDFVPGSANHLLAYANRYAPRPAPAGYQVRFLPYDWTVANSRRKR